MRHPLLAPSLLALALVAVLIAGGIWAARVIAQDATPVAGGGAGTTTIVLVEHNDNMTDIDLGDEGPSAGDIRVWGPNPLYDADNVADTGATSQGSCIALDAAHNCLLNETVVFPDGSTLEIQGIQPGVAGPSLRTIVGGSGEYLGAGGTIGVAPTEDETIWEKTFEIRVPGSGRN